MKGDDEPAHMHALFKKGIALFNEGEYFECHEVLEQLWHLQDEPEKQFTQGILQAAVATYHVNRKNQLGAERLYVRALGRLRQFPNKHRGVDVSALIAQIESALHSLDQTHHLHIDRAENR